MSKLGDLVISAALAVLLAGPGMAGSNLLGRPAEPDEIAAWDKDISPDGTGLPIGQGSVADGDLVFAQRCATCHGDFAEGVGNWPSLSGGFDTLDSEDPVKTVGSYWPYLSTLFDYIQRSKPYGNAQSLEVDEVYALVAYLLYSNDLVADDFTLSRGNFLDVKMPNAGGFIVDDRAGTEYPRFSQTPCMQGCRDPVKIINRATDLGVTPAPLVAEVRVAPIAPDVPKAGEKVFRKDVQAVGDAENGATIFDRCKGCHQVGQGAKNRAGPQLNGIFGRKPASVDGFRYSKGIQRAADGGLIWDLEALDAYLENPKALVSGTSMSFRGLKEQHDRADVLAFLRGFSDDPSNIPEAAPTAIAQEVVLSPKTLAIVGDPEYGEYLSSECTTCHQKDGSDQGIPSITRWPATDFVLAMQAYKQKIRPHPVMQMMAGRLDDEEIAALAAYFEALEE